MLQDNLVALRKAKGLSQEEVAIRLHVVRQTISKWEKGLSVPDAHLLIKLAELFEVSVTELLGGALEGEEELSDVAQQLSRINEQLAIKNQRSHRIWKTISIVIISFVVGYILLIIFAFAAVRSSTTHYSDVQQIEVEAIEDASVTLEQ